MATTIKCRRINSVGKTHRNIFKFVFKKLFRIHNIKLYKLMVIKTNYVNNISIKHKKKRRNKVK